MKLPPLTVSVAEITLDATERDFYECVYKRTASSFDKCGPPHHVPCQPATSAPTSALFFLEVRPSLSTREPNL